MIANTLKRRAGAAALMLAAAALAGCAAFGTGTPEQTVQKRANDYWKARMAGQYEKAYALSTPSYRKLRTAEQFKTQFGAGAAVQGAEVAKVECEAEKCTARMKLSVQPPLVGIKLGVIESYLNDTWVLEDGQWWHYQEL